MSGPDPAPADAGAWFHFLDQLARRPEPFSRYTIEQLWSDPHTSAQMLAFHLDEDSDLASRNAAFIERSVSWLVSRFDIGPSSRVIDFGCGPGLYTSRLARTGAAVTGVDFSARSLQHARQQAERESLNIRYLQQDYLTWSAGAAERFDLATLIMCDYCAMGPERRRQLLERIRDGLGPDGALVLDVYGLDRFQAFTEECRFEANLLNGFFAAEPYYGFLHRYRYPAARVTLDHYTIVRAGGCDHWYNWLAHFTPEMLTRELRQAGFAVETWLGDVAGAPTDAATLSASGADFAVIAHPVPGFSPETAR